MLLHGVTPVVAINAFPGDFASEYEAIHEIAASMGVRCAVSPPTSPTAGPGPPSWPRRWWRRPTSRASSGSSTRSRRPLRQKIETIATAVYGADGVDFSPAAARGIDLFEANGFGRPPHLHRQDPPVDLVGSDA